VRATLIAFALLTLAIELLAGGRDVINLWPEGIPESRLDASPERQARILAGKVYSPSPTIYPAPVGKTRGMTVIVCPGGENLALVIENAGNKVADSLNSLNPTIRARRWRRRLLATAPTAEPGPRARG
jgi:hypothetical protein